MAVPCPEEKEQTLAFPQLMLLVSFVWPFRTMFFAILLFNEKNLVSGLLLPRWMAFAVVLEFLMSGVSTERSLIQVCPLAYVGRPFFFPGQVHTEVFSISLAVFFSFWSGRCVPN